MPLSEETVGGITSLQLLLSGGITYIGTPYYFIKNLQGDVTHITDADGKIGVQYNYDAWGKPTSTTVFDTAFNSVAYYNPYRYRSYYYDVEIGLYYLQSRYYDPNIGRFINGDSSNTILQKGDEVLKNNLFSYCYNNSTNYLDFMGYQPKWAQVVSRYAKGTVAYKTFLLATQKGWFSDLFWVAGFFRTSDGVYHTRQNCWQQFFGYNNFYDWAFSLGTSMKRAKFPFYYKGRSCIFWAWKGDYLNLGAGAELGIYYGGEWHWKVDKNLALEMSLTLKYKGRTIIQYNPGKVWWLTGFNPYYQNVKSYNLTSIYTINFSSKKDMFNVFYNKYGIGKYKSNKWKFNKKSYKATLTF